MKLYNEKKNYKIYQGSMLDMLEVIEKESIDSIVTDPPYELNFMNKGWDNSGIAFNKETWEKCYEVLKPGGYLLAFGGSRTFHRIACAIEDAGFEIRDTIMWLYGSGFPKSMDISKQIDKMPNRSRKNMIRIGEIIKENRNKNNLTQRQLGELIGVSRELINLYEIKGNNQQQIPTQEQWLKIKEVLRLNDEYDYIFIEAEREVIGQRKSTAMDGYKWLGEKYEESQNNLIDITAPATDLAKQWQGWGTCLKPSYEPIIVARKPFKGSLVDNVIENGVGGINIDECRVGNEERIQFSGRSQSKSTVYNSYNQDNAHYETVQGRFPANTILTYDETDFDEVCGGFPNTKSDIRKPSGGKILNPESGWNNNSMIDKTTRGFNDSGSASRYFMNCKYTRKDEEIWKQLLVNNVENNLEILKATKDNIVQMNVEDLLKELKDHYAKYVDNQLDLTETSIVQDIVEMLTWDFKIGTSQVIQDFIINSKKCIQFLNLVQFVEKMDNIDTTQTTQNLLKLFGYVKVVITNYIQGNIEYDQKRYIYTPKASKRDRDEGLDLFNQEKVNDGRQTQIDNPFQRGETPRKNIHPTVKPTDLMQYLVRLVSPKGATILDCFMGSGSTGKAVMYENKDRGADYKFIGIELTEEYLPIAQARIEYICNLEEEEKSKIKQITIFDEM